jgi:uncharacterized membrane protein YkoI
MTSRSPTRYLSRLLLAAAAITAFALALAVTHADALSSAHSITISRIAAHMGTRVADRNPGQVVLADGRISMQQAVKLAEQKFKARVVRAESQDEGGKTVYVLRLLNDSGRVWTVRVDAATGTVT